MNDMNKKSIVTNIHKNDWRFVTWPSIHDPQPEISGLRKNLQVWQKTIFHI